jgi:hypothetical protein
VIVVDDGSTDGTALQLDGLPVTLLVHPHNRGKAASLRTAFAHAWRRTPPASSRWMATASTIPADAPLLLAAWRRNPRRIVIGSRLHDRSQFPPARWRANRFACFWISWAAGHPIADSQSGFRVYPGRSDAAGAGTDKVRGSRFTFESEVLIEAARHGHPTLALAIPGRYPVNARPATSARSGHHQDRADGGRPPAAQRHGAHGPVAQPAAGDGAARTQGRDLPPWTGVAGGTRRGMSLQ